MLLHSPVQRVGSDRLLSLKKGISRFDSEEPLLCAQAVGDLKNCRFERTPSAVSGIGECIELLVDQCPNVETAFPKCGCERVELSGK